MSVRQILIFGLGNYSYPNTRHSVGQLIVDSLAAQLGIHMAFDRKIMSWMGQREVHIKRDGVEMDVNVALAKSKYLMNISGSSVAKTYSLLRGEHHKAPSFPIVLIHDSTQHKRLALSPKFGGSAGGHNGIRDAIERLGTADFHRLRVGVGIPERGFLVEYVLDELSKEERDEWGSNGSGVNRIWDAVEKIIVNEERKSLGITVQPSKPARTPKRDRRTNTKKENVTDENIPP